MKESRIRITKDHLPFFNHQSERAFAMLLLTVPHLEVYFEPEKFQARYQGEKRSAVPDFLVINTKSKKPRRIYVEITTSDCPEDDYGTRHDPKQRQRAVLRKNGVDHVVLYKHHLQNIQKRHSELDFGLGTSPSVRF